MRRLIAAIACRLEGSRLYGKPLQNIDVAAGTSILSHLVALLRSVPEISEIVLGISDGPANAAFVEFAAANSLRHVIGDKRDVLSRLIACARLAGGTDVFRITSESPFCYFEPIAEAWTQHTARGNDVTVTDELPDGCHFEIYRLAALEASHERGDARHRSEFCNLYIREHRSDFRVEVIPVPEPVRRSDLRLTVDYPEDLVVCRHVYAALKTFAPRIPLERIVAHLDAQPPLKTLVQPYVSSRKIW
jgi:spore coat polysaccharide biosynthesis protein SpsF